MYKLILENASGSQLVFNRLGGAFTITDIDGLAAPAAIINTNESALMDGATYNSAKAEMRTINLAFVIEYDAEANRIAAYNVIRIKKPITLRYKSKHMDVYIEGYVQAFEITHMENKQISTVSILCPAPFFKAAQEMVNELDQIIGTFHFPFSSTAEPQIVFGYIETERAVSVVNEGNVECGIVIELYARAAVTNPKVFNYITGEYIALDYSLQTGDLVTITTERGHKTATLLREGVESNLFNYIGSGTTWLQLEPGENEFVYSADASSEMLSVTISHRDLFEGV